MLKKIRFSIPTLTFLTLTSLTFILLTIFSILVYKSNQNKLKVEFKNYKKELLDNSKKTLVELVNAGINIIEAGKNNYNIKAQRRLKNETIKFKTTCLQLTRNITPKAQKIEKIKFITNVLSNTPDFSQSQPFSFLIDVKSETVIFPTNILLNMLNSSFNSTQYNIEMRHKINRIIKETVSSKKGYYFDSLFSLSQQPGKLISKKCFTLFIPELNLILGCAYQDKQIEKVAKQNIFSYLSKLGAGEDEYVYVLNSDGLMLYHPDKELVNRNLINTRDVNGLEIVKAAFNISKTNPEGGFLEYVWWRIGSSEAYKKLGFTKYIPELGWVVTSAIFLADFDQILKTKEQEMKNNLQDDLLKALYLLILTIAIEFIISALIFIKIKSYINIFTSSIKETIQEHRLLDTKKFDIIELEEICTNTNLILLDLLHAEKELKSLTVHLEDKVTQRTVELQSKTEELETSTKLANAANKAKSDFLANMSHEIRTPMNIILGMQQLMLDSNIDTTQYNYLTQANQAAVSLLGIIDDILDFSKIEAGKLKIEHIDLNIEETVSNVISFLNFEAVKKNIKVILDYDRTIPDYVVGDPLRLRQIFSNICSNSIKFTTNGEIVISCNVISTKTDRITIRFKIKDSGIGIPYQKQKELFQPFIQADSSTTRRYGGTGLGLIICKHLVELHGGKIELHSIKDKGTTVTFDIPFMLKAHSNSPSYTISKNHLGEKILIVSSHSLESRILQRYLDEEGFVTKTVASIIEIESLINSNIDQASIYNTVIINSETSDPSGAITLNTIKSHLAGQSTNFIFMTDKATPEVIKSAKETGFNLTVSKPFTPSNLLHAIENPHLTLNKEVNSTNANNKKDLFKNKSILVVEDNTVNQDIAKNLLEKTGCKVSLANNGQDAVNAVRRSNFDLVFMDIQMPVLDGFEATREIRKFNTAVPIVAMTAHALNEDQEKSLESGMNGHITKPVKVETFYSTIQEYAGSTPTNDSSSTINQTNDFSPSTMQNDEVNEEQNDTQISNLDKAWDKILTLPQINIQEAFENTGNNKDLLISIYKDYKNLGKDVLAKLRASYTDKNMDDMLHIAHSLKGTCGTIGEMSIQSLAFNLESKLRDSLDNDIEEEYNLLEAELSEFIHALSNIF